MKPTLVTGASGFVGWHVAKKLLERGHRVRALIREGNTVGKLDLETVRGDLRDPGSLEQAVAGCGTVFHVAADYRLWAADPRELYRSNVDGTKNLLEAARRAGVERFVYTSTVGCIGVPPGQIGDEDSAVRMEDMVGAYKRSKYIAELAVIDFAHTGFPVVIVNPTTPIGERDPKPTPTGRIVLDYINGRMPAYIDTGLNLVDVRDVAEGHLLACERGRSGDRYILGSQNLTLQQIFGKLERVSGTKAPAWRMPYGVALTAGALSTGWARLTGSEPRVPLDAVRAARKRMWVTHKKAEQKLGYMPSGVDGALTRAVQWFRENGYR